MSRLTVQPLIPASWIPAPLTSSSKHIVKKRLVEILPESQVTYSPDGNNRMTFNVSSSSDFMIAQESFMRFELRTIGTAAGVSDAFRHLNTGGVHALFSRMEVRLPNGTQIELIDDYARWYSINSSATHSKGHVDHMEAASGDSSNWRPYMDPMNVSPAYTNASVADLTASRWRFSAVYTGADAAVIEDLFHTSIVPVGSVMQSDTANAAAVTAGLSTLFSGSGLIEPSRMRVCKGSNTALTSSGYTCTLKPFLQFLSQSEVIPLALIQGGFQLVIDLASAVQAMSLHEDIAANATETLDYNIVCPRYFVQLAQPSEEIMKDYIALYNAGKLNYVFRGMRHYLNVQNGSQATMSFPLNVNVRSARQAITVVQNYKANTATQNGINKLSSYLYDTTGKFLKAGISSYQYQAGSSNWPERPVQLRITDAVDDIYMSEAFSHLMKTFGHHGTTLFEPRFQAHDWWSINSEDTVDLNESFKLIMAARLDRGDDKLVGEDLSINPLNLILESSGAYNTALASPSSRYIHSYITFDVVLSVSSDGIIIRK